MPAKRLSFLFAAVLLLGGCSGDELGRHAISGTVKVDGQPLAKGNIGFWPVEGQATSGGDEVVEGKYSVPRDKGLVAGKYQVQINAPVPGTGGKPDENSLPGDPAPAPKEMIPPEWNSASKQTIDVRQQGPFDFNFEISTKSNAAKAKP